MYYKEKYICTKSFIFGLLGWFGFFCYLSLMSHYDRAVKNEGSPVVRPGTVQCCLCALKYSSDTDI